MARNRRGKNCDHAETLRKGKRGENSALGDSEYRSCTLLTQRMQSGIRETSNNESGSMIF